MSIEQATIDGAPAAPPALVGQVTELSAGPPDEATRADLAKAAELEQADNLEAAVDLLIDRHRVDPHPMLEKALVPLRHAAGTKLAGAEPTARSWPDHHPDLWPATDLVEIPVADLSAETIGSAILNHGCLIVRGAFDEATAERLRGNIDRSFAARDALERRDITADQASPWYSSTDIGGRIHQAFGRANYVRAIDSPRGLAELLGAFDSVGLIEAARGYLGERAAFSAHKANLRRTVVEGPNTPPAGGDYHQDGAFLGESTIRTVNVWTSLSHCGVDAPSIDLVPRRLDGVLPTGRHGALFEWTVPPVTAERLAGDAGIIRPVFAPGDLLIFDDLLLHRTGYSEGMTQNRYATETWMFATSCYPERQVPILI